MKKSPLIIVLVTITLLGTKAQSTIGPSVGMTFSTVSNLKSSDYITPIVTGIQFGIAFNLTGGKVFSFQPEILYVQKGYNIKSKYSTNIFSKYNINYIEIPALFKFSFGNKNIKEFFDFGPDIGCCVSAKYTYREQPNDPVNQENLTGGVFDIGLGLGGGISYKIGTDKLILDLRYDLGLLYFAIDGQSDLYNTRTFGISLAYLFNLKKQ